MRGSRSINIHTSYTLKLRVKLIEMNILNLLSYQLVTKTYGFFGEKKKKKAEWMNHGKEGRGNNKNPTKQTSLIALMELN